MLCFVQGLFRPVYFKYKLCVKYYNNSNIKVLIKFYSLKLFKEFISYKKYTGKLDTKHMNARVNANPQTQTVLKKWNSGS